MVSSSGVPARAVRVEDIDMVEAHALEAFVQRGRQIFARAADAVGAGDMSHPAFEEMMSSLR